MAIEDLIARPPAFSPSQFDPLQGFSQGQDFARQRGLEQAFSQGLPRGPDGQVDFPRMLDTLARYSNNPQQIAQLAQQSAPYALTPQVQSALGGGQQSAANPSEPRGIRNNNPLNLEASPFTQQQPGFVGSDGRFGRFESQDQGLAAADRLLQGYSGRGISTISGIINRWAPSSDGNNTQSYAATVARAVGVDPNTPIDLSNPQVRQSVLSAMAQVENGRPLPAGQSTIPANAQPTMGPSPNGPSAQAPTFGQAQPQQPSQDSQLPPRAQRLLALLAQPGLSQGQSQAITMELQRILPPTPGRPEFKEIGVDRNGNKVFGFVDPVTQRVTPANAQGVTGTGPQPDANLSGPAFLQTLDPGRAAQVKAIVEGRMAPPTSMSLRSPQVQGLLRDAAQYEPGFDTNIWTQRNATTRDFASGMSARNVTALNTVIGHLDDLRQKAIALDNYRIPAANWAANFVSSATGDPRIAGFRLASKAVADELAKVFRQTGMSDSEIRQWHSALSENLSPPQMRETISTAVHLLDSRLSALGDQRNRGFAHSVEPRSLLNPEAQRKLQAIEAWASGGQPQQAPQAAPASQPGGPAVGQTINGYRFRGGDPRNQASWEPAQ